MVKSQNFMMKVNIEFNPSKGENVLAASMGRDGMGCLLAVATVQI